MKDALKIITKKKLGLLIVRNRKEITTGIVTDGTIRRASNENKGFLDMEVKKIMTKNPIKVDQDTLAVKALSIMNSRKITSLLIDKKNKKTIGVVHIHNILEANIQ